MSIRFVQGFAPSPYNKYVQFRYMLESTDTTDFVNAANWQGVDDEPTAGSDNLVKSGGVAADLDRLENDVDQLKSDVEQLAYVKIKNEVVNGGFESGTPPWSGKRPVLSEEEKLSGDSSGYADVDGTTSYSIIDIVCDLNDKLYISVSRRFKSLGVVKSHAIRISDFGSLTNHSDLAPFYNGNLDVWETTTAIVDGRTNGIRLGVGLMDTSIAQYFVDNFIVVNLTETFGKGSEPTKEEFELLLDILGIDYFEGEITIPAQKIMQWQLKLIRENKNAIIALNGTII
jgi:hypothetical protein